jgi:hypothetical protein
MQEKLQKYFQNAGKLLGDAKNGKNHRILLKKQENDASTENLSS